MCSNGPNVSRCDKCKKEYHNLYCKLRWREKELQKAIKRFEFLALCDSLYPEALRMHNIFEKKTVQTKWHKRIIKTVHERCYEPIQTEIKKEEPKLKSSSKSNLKVLQLLKKRDDILEILARRKHKEMDPRFIDNKTYLNRGYSITA